MELCNGALVKLYYRDEEIVHDAETIIAFENFNVPSKVAGKIGTHLDRHEGEKFTIKISFGAARGTFFTPIAFTQDNKKRVSKLRALAPDGPNLSPAVTYEKKIHIFGTERGTLYTEFPQNSFRVLFASQDGYWWTDQVCIVCQAGTFYLVWSQSNHTSRVYRAEDGRFCDPSVQYSEWIGLQDLLNEIIPPETNVLPVSEYPPKGKLFPRDGEITGSATI